MVVLRAIFLLAVCAACEAIVNPSVNLMKCDSNNSCLQGYSCRYDQCVAVSSLDVNETCTDSSQCKPNLTCPAGINVCATPCTKIYQFNDSECSDSSYPVCVPVFDRKTGSFSGGACVATECTANTTCQDTTNQNLHFATAGPGVNCVRLAANGGLCLAACTIGEYKTVDSCLTDIYGNATHCGIINAGASPDYICLPAGNAQAGEACALFPQSGSTQNSADACATVTGSLPLVCMASDGTLTGDLRCQQVCAQAGQTLPPSSQYCAANQQCEYYNQTNTNFAYCGPPSTR